MNDAQKKQRERALRLESEGKTVEAFEEYKSALDSDPGDVFARTRLADLALALGRKDEAIEALEKVSESYAADGLLLKAMAIVKQILTIDPAHARTKNMLAELAKQKSGGSWKNAPETKKKRMVSERPASRIEDLLGKNVRTSTPPVRSSPEREALSIPLFSELPRGAFIEILRDLKMHEKEDGDVIIKEGERGDSFFVLTSGSVRVEKSTKEGPVVLAHLGEGAFFGEMALLSDSPRTASVIADDSCKILELDRALIERTKQRYPSVSRVLHDFYKQRLLNTTLQMHPWFQPFTQSERRQLISVFKSRNLSAGDVLIEEGKKGQGLYVLLSGALEVSKVIDGNERAIAKLEPGHMFGEMTLLADVPTFATIRALGDALVLRLSKRYFDEVAKARPEIRQTLQALSEERAKTNQLTLENHLV